MGISIAEAKARARTIARAIFRRNGAPLGQATATSTKVAELMTSPAHTCTRTARLQDVARVLWDHDCGCVPIVDSEQRLCGILTDRDLAIAAFTQGRSLTQIEVSSLLPQRVHFCEPGDSLERAISLMRTHCVRRLPVLSPRRSVVGVVSLADVALHVSDGPESNGAQRRALVSLLACLSRPRRHWVDKSSLG